MSKTIMGLLLAAGAWFVCVSDTWSQEVVAENSWLPYQWLGLKNVPIQKHGDTIYVLAGNESSTEIYCRSGAGFWSIPGYGLEEYHDPYYYEFSLSSSGDPFVYNRYDGTLKYFHLMSFESVNCPGRPMLDIQDNIHILWRNLSDTTHYYYGYSTDTLRTFNILDTLSSQSIFLHIVKSPNDSIVGALFYDYQIQSLIKYFATDGQAIDFSNPTEIVPADYWITAAFDYAIDNSGRVYLITTILVGGIYGSHEVWTESYGYSYLEDGNDDANLSPGFEFIFGPNNGEVILIKNGSPPNGYNGKYFVTTDYGSSWSFSSYETPFGYSKYYGSSPRSYSDTIHYTYCTTYPDHNTYYLSIPRDSIFNNLVSIDEEDAPIPGYISLFNYPNPFNASTTISFNLPKAGQVTLTIYDIAGREIKQLVEGDYEVGPYSIIWDGQDSDGQIVSSGIYFYKLDINGNRSATKEMIFLK
jgi:hypothetical protein